MRKLGLDLGSKSCGIALSDSLNIIAQGLENFTFPEKDWQVLVNHLKNTLYFQEVDKIILGYPLLPSGDKSSTTLMIEQFKDFLASQVDQEIIYEREDKTTKKAHEVMIAAGLTRKRRKNYKDKIAATLILQGYLDRS